MIQWILEGYKGKTVGLPEDSGTHSDRARLRPRHAGERIHSQQETGIRVFSRLGLQKVALLPGHARDFRGQKRDYA